MKVVKKNHWLCLPRMNLKVVNPAFDKRYKSCEAERPQCGAVVSMVVIKAEYPSPELPQPHALSVASCLRFLLPAHNLCPLPSKLAFWALFHCRHARPPDTHPLR